MRSFPFPSRCSRSRCPSCIGAAIQTQNGDRKDRRPVMSVDWLDIPLGPLRCGSHLQGAGGARAPHRCQCLKEKCVDFEYMGRMRTIVRLYLTVNRAMSTLLTISFHG